MKKLLFLCLIAGVVLAIGGTSEAIQTTVYDTTYNVDPYYEWDLESGLPTLDTAPSPGGSYEGANDILDYYYSSWTRIDDAYDQLWYDLDGGAKVVAKYTSSGLRLGYALDETVGDPINWINGSGGGYLDTVGETGSFNVDDSDAFAWVIGGAGNKYSLQTLNPGGTDYMVSFLIQEIWNDPDDQSKGCFVPDDPTYVIAFEDGTDQDYQDFVAQVSNTAPVPEPATMLLLGSGLMGLVVFGRKKFFRKS
jgi:hypothetical protein